MKNQLNKFLIHTSFLTMTTISLISLICCCEKLFHLMNIWMIGEKFNETLLPEKGRYL